MDVRMPGKDGIEATSQIRELAPECRVLMLTMYDDDATVLTAMQAGAQGYLLKEAEQDDIVRVVHGVVAGEAISGPRGPKHYESSSGIQICSFEAESP